VRLLRCRPVRRPRRSVAGSDEFGGGVANTFPYLNPKAKSGTSTTSLFTYWTEKTSSSDPLYTLIHANDGSATGINTPAPWVPFTRAGCDCAGVGSADMEFENDTSDIANVYGSTSLLQNNGFAWNHGDIQPQIATTWQGWVGLGIRNLGETSSVWTDHTDARPTMMTVLGLHEDYSWDGAAIAQIIGSAQNGRDWWSRGQNALPWTIRANERGYEDLAAAYKQLNAPFGEFGLNTRDADTSALASNSANDATYTDTTSQLQACESERTALVGQIQSVLEPAESGHAPVSSWEAFDLVGQADRVIDDAKILAGASTPPSFTVCS
jgi:hypothetical protein